METPAERNVLRLFVLESTLASAYLVVGLEMAPGESHVGSVFEHQRPLLRRDLARGRQYPMEGRAFEDGVRSYAIVPLVVHGRSKFVAEQLKASGRPCSQS